MIEDYTFNEWSSLIGIIIPSFVKLIGNYSFNECIQLTKITIPSSIKTIGSYKFSQCINLTEITISSSVKSTKIELDAFVDCPFLNIISYQNQEQSPVQNTKIVHKSNINIIVIGSGSVGKTSIL